MSGRFNPQSPDNYPVAWLTAAGNACEKPETWISVDWARGEAGAVARMKRLRAFAKGLLLFPQRAPRLSAALTDGMELRFRKQPLAGVWDVQMSLQPRKEKLSFEVVEGKK